jgi:ATP-dependent RNA helicase DeaD
MIALLEKAGITTPTQIQVELIPAIIGGRDVLAQSETGSGKTLSFAIPIIENLTRRDGLRALVLVPTRELCTQIADEFIKFSQGKGLGITSVYGGVSIGNQIKKVKSTNIVIATPGRLLDLLERREVDLSGIKYLVFDEADRMLDMGFIKDIERILKHVPATRQTVLCSATMSSEITQLSRKYLKDPLNVALASVVKAEFLHQTYYQTSPDYKLPLLIDLLKHDRDLALVFCNRKHITTRLAKKLSAQGVHARCLNGNMSQPQRERVTADFRAKKFTVLVATDVAARGLHIDDITHVYNYEIPKDVESYTHRIGRTARAGKRGEAISIVASEDERKFFKQILFTHKGSITLKTIDGQLEPEALKADSRQEGRPAPQRGRQQGGRSQGGRSQGGRSQGERSQGERSHGGRPQQGERSQSRNQRGTARPSRGQGKSQQKGSQQSGHESSSRSQDSPKGGWKERWQNLLRKKP